MAVLAFVVGIPTLAAADPVNDALNNLGLGSGGSGGGSATPNAGTPVPPSSYTPPIHGTNPHGQGTDAVVDLTPSNSNPYPGQPDGSEEVIVGDSRGEQTSDGSYHGNVALLYLFGNAILGIETAPGETEDGPFQPIQDGLDQLCDQSNGALCVSLLEMHSSTTGNSSTNSFEALGAHLGGEEGINADVATSHGNIASDGTCQTAHGDSSVADANVGPLFADVLQGSSTSTACNNGSQSVDQSSKVINLGPDPAPGVPLPAAGCANGEANTNFTALAPLLATVCNANDTNGSQTGAPYGVREALTVFALITGDTSVLKATTAGPESHAVAPPGGTTPTTPGNPGGGTKGAGGKGGGAGGNGGGAGNGAGAGNGSAAGAAAAGNGQLAFTGADLLALGMVGTALILGGLALTTTAGRRHRQTV